MARRPAVSTISTSAKMPLGVVQRGAGERPPASGWRPDGNHSTSSCLRQQFEAARWRPGDTSADTSKDLFLFCSFSSWPACPRWWFYRPCKPAISTMAGGTAARFNASFLSPIRRVSSSLTTPTTAWPGGLPHHLGGPMARSRTSLMNVFTTGSANIGFQRRHAHFTHGVLDVLSQPGVAAQVLDHAGRRVVRLSSMGVSGSA